MTTGPAVHHADWRAAGPARGVDWSRHAACRRLHPDFVFKARNRAEALHICHRHCPVLQRCHDFTLSLTPPPTDCVMGGLPWRMYHDRPSELTSAPVHVDRCRLCPGAAA